MALTKGKHQIAEIAGVNCSTVETGLSEERMNFLKDLLEFNGYAVQTETEKSKEGSSLGTFVIGITDLLFNPMIAVYQKKTLTQRRESGKSGILESMA